MKIHKKIGPYATSSGWSNRYKGKYLACVDGGYPAMYLSLDCYGNQLPGLICAECATDAWKDRKEIVTGLVILFEGPPEICENCNKIVETAYGDPDEESEESA